MVKYKVEDIVVSGAAKELEKVLNEASEKVEEQGWEIINIMFIGNNSSMGRIYQAVCKKEY